MSFKCSILHNIGSFLKIPNGTRTNPSRYCFDLFPWSSPLLLISFNFNKALSFIFGSAFINMTCCSNDTFDTSHAEIVCCVNSIVLIIVSLKYCFNFHGNDSYNITCSSLSIPSEFSAGPIKSYNIYAIY